MSKLLALTFSWNFDELFSSLKGTWIQQQCHTKTKEENNNLLVKQKYFRAHKTNKPPVTDQKVHTGKFRIYLVQEYRDKYKTSLVYTISSARQNCRNIRIGTRTFETRLLIGMKIKSNIKSTEKIIRDMSINASKKFILKPNEINHI